MSEVGKENAPEMSMHTDQLLIEIIRKTYHQDMTQEIELVTIDQVSML